MSAQRALALACAALALAVPQPAVAAEAGEGEQTTEVRYAYSRHVMDHRPLRHSWNTAVQPPDDVRLDILAPLDGSRVASRQGSLRIQVSVRGMDVPGQGHFSLYFDNDTELVLPCRGMRERRGERKVRRLDVDIGEVEPGEHRVILVAQLESGAFGAKGVNFTTYEADSAYQAPSPQLPLGITDPTRASREAPAKGLGMAHFTVPGRPKHATAPTGDGEGEKTTARKRRRSRSAARDEL